MTKFQIGKTYETRSICDHNAVFRYTIKDRTNKSVSIYVNGRRVGRRIFVLDDIEQFMPLGRYSMAPVIKANKLAEFCQ